MQRDLQVGATPVQRRRRRWRARAVLVALIVVPAMLVWLWGPVNDRALTAASYAARVACSCHFVAGRPLEACKADLPPGMGNVTLSADEEEKSVTARYVPLSSQSAHYAEGPGCVLQPLRR